MIYTKYVTVNGVALNYFHTGVSTLPGVVPDLGKGELLLFVHGAGSNGHTWHRQLAAFGERHSALALDFPGHGRSAGTEGLRSIADYRDCLVGFIDALGLRPSVVVGCCMGGAVALDLALTQPQHVKALVLVATAARYDLPQATLDTWHDVMRGRVQQPFTTEAFSPATDFALMRELWMEQVKTDPRVRYFDLVACNAFDVTPRLPALRLPALIVAGRDDHLTSPDKAEILHRGIQASELEIIEGAGHHVQVGRADALNDALRHFVEGLA
jgi:pimeloyl-ACP methyl ester carboxylesterase